MRPMPVRSLQQNAKADSGERIQRFLSRGGFGSRRRIEEWIRAGRLFVDGTPAYLGQCVQGHESFRLDAEALHIPVTNNAPAVVLLYHKPEGEVCSTVGERGQRTVFESLPDCQQGRWIQVGRLDFNTSGLLLFTNDGDLAHELMHPRTGIERVYMVRVHGLVEPEVIARLTRGVDLEDGPARFTRIVPGSGGATNRWYEVALSEGRNRIVRRLWASQGYDVTRLMRVRFGTLALPRDMPPGAWRYLSHDDLAVFSTLSRRPPPRRIDN